jgi:NADPH:quinone reductase-like Zn-dependent oxidoreductase
MYTTEAWVLYRGEAGAGPGHLEFESISFPSLSDDEVLIEPLYGAWEANMSHAVDRDPIDICDLRGEEKVVLGNSGVVRVLDVGRCVRNVQPGQYCLFAPVGESDPFGYQQTVHGYDAPGTIGTLARKTKIACTGVYPLPSGTKFSLQQWAAFSLRYIAAWSNWSVAYRCFRVQLSIEDFPVPYVWGWGGGCTLAELDLAQRVGCEAVMLSGNDRNIKDIENWGITTIDRRSFPDLNYDRKRYAADEEYRNAYRLSEYAFLIDVRERTAGNGVSIFVDYIGSPVSRASIKALSRQGVLTTAGWKHGMVIPLNRAMECISRHIYVHTHSARAGEVEESMAYGEENGWMPQVAAEDTYRFEDVPQLLADYAEGQVGYFPVYEVNP